MFNLEQSINEWRRQMLAAGIKTSALAELESHLREEFERQVCLGIHGQQALGTAVLKIGPARELKTEYSKVNWLWNILQMELLSKEKGSIMIPAFCLAAANLFFGIIVIGKLGETRVMTFPEYISAVTAMVVSNLLCSSCFLGRRFFPVIPGKWTRLGICTAVALLIALSPMIFLARPDFGTGQSLMAICWAFFAPMGALGGLIFGLEIAAQKKAVS